MKQVTQFRSVKYSPTFVISVLPPGPPAQPTNLTVMARTPVSVTLGWTCGHNGGDDNMWFVLIVVNEDTNYTINIPADCGVGERNQPDYRVEVLDGSTLCTFLLTAQNRFTNDVELLQTAKYIYTTARCVRQSMLYDILLPIVLLTGNLKRMAQLELTDFVTDAPEISITSVSIQDTSVNVDWTITTGDVYALQLRHHPYSQSQRYPSDIEEWSMTYDLNPDDGSEVIEGTVRY